VQIAEPFNSALPLMLNAALLMFTSPWKLETDPDAVVIPSVAITRFAVTPSEAVKF
jgi:cation transporter-like permease